MLCFFFCCACLLLSRPFLLCCQFSGAAHEVLRGCAWCPRSTRCSIRVHRYLPHPRWGCRPSISTTSELVTSAKPIHVGFELGGCGGFLGFVVRWRDISCRWCASDDPRTPPLAYNKCDTCSCRLCTASDGSWAAVCIQCNSSEMAFFIVLFVTCPLF